MDYGRYTLHSRDFLSIRRRLITNYLLCTQFPGHSKLFFNDFKRLQMKLCHGITSEDEFHLRHTQIFDLHDRAALPISSGGTSLRLRCMESTYLVFFLASMVK